MPIARLIALFKRALKPALFAFAALALSSCYLPVKFDAEIELDRAGYYSMIFDGYIAQIELYRDLAGKQLSKQQEAEKVQTVKTDLTRDSAVSDFAYYGKGVFRVHWEKKGDLLQTRMITFLRRNNAVLSLKYVKDTKLITMTAGGMSKDQREQLTEAGLTTTGELRLITDAKARVVDHNATDIRTLPSNPSKVVYIWKIQGLNSPTPRFVMQPG